MNLCGEFITHKVFGRGQIVESSDDCVTILFEAANEKKKFIYPSSIGTYILLENKKLAKQIQDYKNEITQTKELEQIVAEDQRQAKRLAALNQAKLARKTAKKATAAKSPSTKAPKKTK